MSEGATVTRADLERIEKMQGDLSKALDDLREASTASEREAARKDVGDARSDLADELQRRRLTPKDLDRIEAIKEEERLEAFLAKREAAAEAAKPKPKRRRKPKDEPVAKPEKKPNPFADLFKSKSHDDGDGDDDDGDDDE